LALSGLGTGAARSLAVTNTSASAITISSLSAPIPALPGSATVDQSSATDCSKVSTLAPRGSCTVTIQPGAAAASSSACTAGTVPTPSVVTIGGNGGALTANASVVILGYGCQYQGGFVFAIDDTTPAGGSIGAEVVATIDQAAAFPNGIDWPQWHLGQRLGYRRRLDSFAAGPQRVIAGGRNFDLRPDELRWHR
jgi:hypothetical protein